MPAEKYENFLPIEYYDALYAQSYYLKDRLATRPWYEQPSHAVTWYPAMLLTQGGEILDVGCGAGHLAPMVRLMGAEYVGIEPSGYALQIAHMRYPWATFYQASAESLWLWDWRWSEATVILLEVLEHVLDDYAVLTQIPKGTNLIVSVPSYETRGHVRWFRDRNDVAEHYRPLIEIDEMIVERAKEGPNRWFVFRGVRR